MSSIFSNRDFQAETIWNAVGEELKMDRKYGNFAEVCERGV